jgi:hypothetical protein
MNFIELTSYLGIMLIGYGVGRLIEYVFKIKNKEVKNDKSQNKQHKK